MYICIHTCKCEGVYVYNMYMYMHRYTNIQDTDMRRTCNGPQKFLDQEQPCFLFGPAEPCDVVPFSVRSCPLAVHEAFHNNMSRKKDTAQFEQHQGKG